MEIRKNRVLEKLYPALLDNGIVIALVVLAVLFRLLPHPANFAPVGAIALFGGAYLNKRQALWLPLAAMIVSDLFIGLHSTILFTWGSFLMIALLGIAVGKSKTVPNVIYATISGSLLFYFVTNFGVWVATPLYSKTLSGLAQCYIMAIPFLRNTLLSDLVFVGALFGSYELATHLLRARVSISPNIKL